MRDNTGNWLVLVEPREFAAGFQVDGTTRGGDWLYVG
jgi:hypothetical protein